MNIIKKGRMLMGIFWVIFCVVVAYYANERGRNALGWGLLAAVISPLLAGIALAIAKDLSLEEDLDDLDKKTENIQREVEHNQEFNELHREKDGGKRITGNKNDGDSLSNGQREALSDRIECENCGEYVAPDNNFCPICGAKVIPEGMKECPECGELIEKGVKYCNKCGKKLKLECATCGRKVELGVNFCPGCGSEINQNQKSDINSKKESV